MLGTVGREGGMGVGQGGQRGRGGRTGRLALGGWLNRVACPTGLMEEYVLGGRTGRLAAQGG